MRKLLIIGIGAGNPEHMTVQAINALNRCGVLLVPTKGDEKAFLADMRRDICDRFVTNPSSRIIEFAVPKRRTDGAYDHGVRDWHRAIAAIYEDLLIQETGESETVGLLVWGDPSLYDSTIRIVEHVRENGRVPFEFDIVPGITSVQALCAAHRIPLNRIGHPVEITTGRRLAAGDAAPDKDTVIMLDGIQAYKTVADPSAEIFWGAYLGTCLEITLSGRLGDIAGEISETRARARSRNGWIMDTYLIRHPANPDDEGAEP